jgi:hypothetical protein
MDYKKWLKLSSILVIVLLIGLGSYYVFGPDNSVEEGCEAVIESETGVDFDLSPDSVEIK